MSKRYVDLTNEEHALMFGGTISVDESEECSQCYLGYDWPGLRCEPHGKVIRPRWKSEHRIEYFDYRRHA